MTEPRQSLPRSGQFNVRTMHGKTCELIWTKPLATLGLCKVVRRWSKRVSEDYQILRVEVQESLESRAMRFDACRSLLLPNERLAPPRKVDRTQ